MSDIADEQETEQTTHPPVERQMTAPKKMPPSTFVGWLLLAGVVLGITTILLWVNGDDAPQTNTSASPPALKQPTALVVPTHGAYTGAYIDFGETEDNVTLEGIEDFEEMVGKHQAIVAFSSFWGEQTFPTQAINVVGRHHSMPLIFWSPWDRPYNEDLIMINKGADKFSLDAVLAGKWDAYIDRWADGARAFGQPMFVSLCNEMNGNWFPWSAGYYGADKVIPGSNPPRYEGPEFFKRAYRYIVDRVRARGAKNILWVFHLNNYSEPMVSWTTFNQYYPGPDYVDWLGLSAYGKLSSEIKKWDDKKKDDKKWDDFEATAKAPYDEICQLDPNKPVMLTEWGIGEFPNSGDKAAWFVEAFDAMQHDYPRLHAAIYWHERWQNSDTQFYSDLRVNSSPRSLDAYQRGLSSSFWLGQPIYR